MSSSNEGVRRLLSAFAIVLVGIAVLSQLPHLYRRAVCTTTPVGRFPLGGIPRTGGGGNLSDGWETGHDGNGRGWLVTWSHLPGVAAAYEVAELGRRNLDALAATEVGPVSVSEHDGSRYPEGDHQLGYRLLRLQGARTHDAFQLLWGCTHAQRGVALTVWAPTREGLPVDSDFVYKVMACHHDGRISAAPPQPIVELPNTYRKESDSLQGSTWSAGRGKEQVLLSGGFRWHEESAPTMARMAGDDFWFRLIDVGVPRVRTVQLPELPHPAWEFRTEVPHGRGWREQRSTQLHVAYAWYCPSHEKVLSARWTSGLVPGEVSTARIPDFLRRLHCAEGCKG